MKTKISLFILMIAATAAFAQHDHSAHQGQAATTKAPEFKDKSIETSYGHYLRLKDALVASKSDEAKLAAGELHKALASLPNGKKAAEIASTISSSTELEEQRKSFSTLSNEFTKLVKESKISSGTLYVAYCPMANNNEGAYWLSNEKEIKNPYFGDMMLKCGSVKETLQ
jgi:hypothetical protein